MLNFTTIDEVVCLYIHDGEKLLAAYSPSGNTEQRFLKAEQFHNTVKTEYERDMGEPYSQQDFFQLTGTIEYSK